MFTFHIQAILGEQFEDLYVEATSLDQAMHLAPGASQLFADAGRARRWVRFVAG
jgi:hypothetical protein